MVIVRLKEYLADHRQVLLLYFPLNPLGLPILDSVHHLLLHMYVGFPEPHVGID